MSQEENKKIADLIKKRDEFLEQHPHLQSLQEEIDRALEIVGNDPYKRMKVIHELMKDIIDNDLVYTANKQRKKTGND